MSAEPYKQEVYKELMEKLLAEDEIADQQKPFLDGEPINGQKVSGAEYALARSTGAIAIADHSLVPEPAILPWARKDNLEKDGCEFIDTIYLFLSELGCPPEARDFVLAVAGISRGNYTEMIPIPDDKIADRMGLSRQAIARKRKSLLAWEQKNDWSVLEIHEKEFNRDTMKYKPTEYRVIVTPYATRFIREYRERVSHRSSPRILGTIIEDDTKQIANQIAEDLPNAPIVRRSQAKYEAKNITPVQAQRQIQQNKDKQLANEFNDWCAYQVQAGSSLRARLEEMQVTFLEIATKHLEVQEG